MLGYDLNIRATVSAVRECVSPDYPQDAKDDLSQAIPPYSGSTIRKPPPNLW